MGARIRRARVEDVVVIVELSSALFREDAGQRDPFMNLNWPRGEGREYFAGLVACDRSLCLLAEFAGVTAGYLVGHSQEETTLMLVKAAELESMYVRERYRGRGVGAALIGEFLGWARARGAQLASVTAYAANEGAIRLYKREGFRPKSLSLETSIG
jgi:GNAT superfamily N-acetyltransferase